MIPSFGLETSTFPFVRLLVSHQRNVFCRPAIAGIGTRITNYFQTRFLLESDLSQRGSACGYPIVPPRFFLVLLFHTPRRSFRSLPLFQHSVKIFHILFFFTIKRARVSPLFFFLSFRQPLLHLTWSISSRAPPQIESLFPSVRIEICHDLKICFFLFLLMTSCGNFFSSSGPQLVLIRLSSRLTPTHVSISAMRFQCFACLENSCI